MGLTLWDTMGSHVALKWKAEPDGEDTWCLLKFWDELAPLLGGDTRIYATVVAMYMLLGEMYGTIFQGGSFQAPEVAKAL